VSVIQFNPIGVVHNAIHESHRETRWETIESEIVIAERWRDALDGLAEFSHIWVIYYLDRMSPPAALHIRPMKRLDLPVICLFATRSPQGPNPIGIRPVELLDVRDSILRVRGLDALDSTPVLDLKPYIPFGDVIANARVGEWVRLAYSAQETK
jgi:tRNA (adenine37-N6)-methyltransferase